MEGRRWISTLLVLAGIVLLAVAGLHYFSGYQAQEEGRRAWEESRAASPVPTLHVPTPAAAENPGITGSLPTPSVTEPQGPPYPQGQPIAGLRLTGWSSWRNLWPTARARRSTEPATLPGPASFLKRCRGRGCVLIQTALLFVALLAAFPADGAAAGKPKHRKTPRRVHREAPIDPAVVNNAALAEPVRPGATGSAILRAQVLLARAHFSCGEIDARYGANLKIAIEDYQSSHGLPAGGIVEEQTWKLLNTDSNPALVRAPIAPEDVAGPFSPV